MSKNEPSKFDGYAKALPDEPTFTLLGRDTKAPHLVRRWAEGYRTAGGPGYKAEKYEEALRIADQMDAFRINDWSKRPTMDATKG